MFELSCVIMNTFHIFEMIKWFYYSSYYLCLSSTIYQNHRRLSF